MGNGASSHHTYFISVDEVRGVDGEIITEAVLGALPPEAAGWNMFITVNASGCESKKMQNTFQEDNMVHMQGLGL